MRILVCGSRTFSDYDFVETVLDGFNYKFNTQHCELTIIEGGAKGADACAAQWVEGFGNEYPCAHEQYPADWDRHGKGAGPIRNRQMLTEGRPDVVLAFVDKPLTESRGTANMVRASRANGIDTFVFYSDRSARASQEAEQT